VTSQARYIAHATCAISYALDNQIRIRVGDVEQAFQPVINSQANGTNVADSAPPTIPRFTLQSGPKQIAVSQVSAQLDLDFTSDGKSGVATFEVVKRNFLHFWEGVCRLKSLAELREVGIVLTFHIPKTASQADLAKLIFDRYMRLTPLGAVASTGFTIGFLDTEKQIFFNISLESYELRQGVITGDLSNRQNISVDVSTLPVKESGIEVKFDVNSRPMLTAGTPIAKDLGGRLFAELEALALTGGAEFLSW
jgi:hypothetical protein